MGKDPETSIDLSTPAMDLQQGHSSPPNSALNADNVPLQHPRDKANTLGVSEQRREIATHRVNDSRARPPTRPITPRRRRIARPARNSASEKKSSWDVLSPFRGSTKRNDDDRDDLISEYENEIAKYENDNAMLSEYIDNKEMEWKERERRLLGNHQQETSGQDKIISELQGKLRRNESEMQQIRENYFVAVRKHQEASFKQLDSARWRPADEGEIANDLDRLKRSMRSWAKDISIKDLSMLSSLADTESSSLMRYLEPVVLVENNTLPVGLSTAARSPILLLNALLAHSVYTGFFQRPFFSFKDPDVESSAPGEQENNLESIYQQVQQANQKDAHIWRSDTLRLLMPPLRHDTLATEKQMRNKTEALIARIADQQALIFLASPARYLISSDSRPDFVSKLKSIYSKAATMSYMLWTRRTYMRCLTLHDLAPLTFDPDCARFGPDPLVRCEGEEEQFRGRIVTVMVHPLLEVCGTDAAEDYDESRVWAAGIVWFDNQREDASMAK